MTIEMDAAGWTLSSIPEISPFLRKRRKGGGRRNEPRLERLLFVELTAFMVNSLRANKRGNSEEIEELKNIM